MKRYINIVAGLALCLTLTGCYDLDLYPSDQLSEGTFFKDMEQADQAMMGVYNAMQSDNALGLRFSNDCMGGISNGYDNPSYQTIQRGNYDVRNGQVSSKWKSLYEGVARANIVLQNLENCNLGDKLKQYQGEAKFMRALFYFELLDFFGGVPLYDETLVVSKDYGNMLSPRSSAADVRTFILKDLQEAANSLPEAWNAENYGRATKYAAIALQGRVYLYSKEYQKASDCFKEVIGSGLYKLNDSYADLFTPVADKSAEMIFAIQNTGGVGTDFGMPMTFYLGSRESFGSCWNNVMPSPHFVDTYEYKDGRPFDWEELFPGITTSNDVKIATFRATMAGGKVTQYPAAKEQLLEMYDQRDPRMQASIILPYTHYTGWFANAIEECECVINPSITSGNGYIRFNGNYENYLWRKFVATGNMGGAINNRADTPINFPIIRYADVLLMQAECENELGNQDAAVALINEVRARPSVNMPAINGGSDWLKATSKEEVFLRIRHERAVELACEGLSFSDMKRWGLLQELDGVAEADLTGKVRYTRSVKTRDYLWPIPATETEKNPDLEQNPEW